MSFRVLARTLIQLGAELISSDAVALLELIKNAFDAGSSRVKIEVVVRIPIPNLREVKDRIRELANDGVHARLELEHVKSTTIDAIDPMAPYSEELANRVRRVKNPSELLELIDESNFLSVEDSGEGMSFDDLDEVFLTIGTRSRLMARSRTGANRTGRPILGEKGVGRLSAMRLGSRLHVETTTEGETRWNLLDIDWSMFSHDSDATLDSFKVAPRLGTFKKNPKISGTTIRIGGLNSVWTKSKTEDLVAQEFTKMTDPFSNTALFPIQLIFNAEPITIPRFNRLLLEHAHATVKAELKSSEDQELRLIGKVRYKGREKTISVEGSHLTSTTDQSFDVLDALGPFSVEIYWYNRRILTALQGIGDRRTVLRLVREWGGGIMVFRDGFRVLPYGGPDDDWLRLDRRALAAPSFAVNRSQIIGRLNLSAEANPALRDQTNREGLQDCVEKEALIALLRHVLESHLRTFLRQVDSEVKASEPIDIEDLDRRVEEEETQIRENVRRLVERVPEMRREQPLIDDVNQAISRLRNLMTEVRDLAASYEAGRGQLLNLAGIGLTVEILAHELNRATEHVLRTLANAKPEDDGADPLSITFDVLEVQLKTLHRRLRVLDPLSTSGRQRKENFDLVTTVKDVIADNDARFEREQITSIVKVEPKSRVETLRIRAVRGMIIQVLGNLIDNSIYWLRQQKRIEPGHMGKIQIVIDTKTGRLLVTDNGPGVSQDMKDLIFEAFVTTKPPGEGKGLGLFIGREIARYHGADLYLTDPKDSDDGRHNTFVLSLEGME